MPRPAPTFPELAATVLVAGFVLAALGVVGAAIAKAAQQVPHDVAKEGR